MILIAAALTVRPLNLLLEVGSKCPDYCQEGTAELIAENSGADKIFLRVGFWNIF